MGTILLDAEFVVQLDGRACGGPLAVQPTGGTIHVEARPHCSDEDLLADVSEAIAGRVEPAPEGCVASVVLTAHVAEREGESCRVAVRVTQDGAAVPPAPAPTHVPPPARFGDEDDDE